MKTPFLLPHHLKRLGWVLFVPGLLLGLIYLIWSPEYGWLDCTVLNVIPEGGMTERDATNHVGWMTLIRNNVLDEIAALLIILGGVLVAFSKERHEDEYIQHLRLSSLVWATYISYVLLALAVLFVYDYSFFTVMSINMFTILIFFILRFRWLLHRSRT